MMKTDRLKFEVLSEKHADDFYRMDGSPVVMKYYRRGIAGSKEESFLRLKEYLDYTHEFPLLGGFMAYDKESQEFVGLAVIIHLGKDPKSPDYEIGYRLPVEQWGKGYATEMARAMLVYGEEKLGLKEFYGTTHPDNTDSQHVLLKVGFKYFGESDHHGGSKMFKLEKSKI